MHGKVQLVVVTEWISRGDAFRFARNTREFIPLFIRKKTDGHGDDFAVCRKCEPGEEVPATHSIYVSKSEIITRI